MADPVVQWQIVATDPDAVTRFYGTVFGWTVTTANALGYREVDTGGVRGGVWPAPPGAPSFVQLFMRVENVERTVGGGTARGDDDRASDRTARRRHDGHPPRPERAHVRRHDLPAGVTARTYAAR